MQNKILVVIGVLAVVVIGFFAFLYHPATPSNNQNNNNTTAQVKSYEDCKNAGYQLLSPAYPSQCKTPDGQVYVQDVVATEIPEDVKAQIDAVKDLIVVDAPTPYSIITSPVKITGKARGNFYFEATFPIDVVDQDGKVIGHGQAKALSDWMTQDFVPFEATIDFPNQNTQGDFYKRGAIVLHNDNPSGLPQNEKSIQIPVLFGQ